MEPLPFKIPQSLSSYLEQFDASPTATIKKLEKQVNRRGLDAVGHFLLAWFYHIDEQNEMAIKHALIAKTYAPGSPLMEHLHYFLIHPGKFEASIPSRSTQPAKKMLTGKRGTPILDLDKLIALLSEVEATKIRIPQDGEPYNDTDLAEDSAMVDDIASETLANIHISQGKNKEAIKVYKKLIETHPEQSDYFQEKIDDLTKKTGD